MTYDLKLERSLSLTPVECFALWSDPVRLAKWWGPKDAAGEPFESEVQAWSLEKGAEWAIKMVAPDGTEFYQGGDFIAVDPPNLLQFSFHWIANGERGPSTEITVRFLATEGGSRMIFEQRGFTDADSRDGHTEGWNECLDRFVAASGANVIEAA